MRNSKKVARNLAKALLQLDYADWQARDWREMSKKIREIRLKVAELFDSTGYEFGAGDGCRIRLRRDA
jgi:hypothetical protein